MSRNKKKIEKYLIKMFKEYSDQIFSDLQLLNESPQLLNAINLVDAYRKVCDELGYIIETDPFYQGMYKLLNLIREKDREIDKKISLMKGYYDYGNDKKKRVEPRRSIDYIKRFINSFLLVKQDVLFDEKKEHEDSLKEQKEKVKAEITPKKESADIKNNKVKKKQKKGSFLSKLGIDKIVDWVDDKVHPEHDPENIALINEFRQNISEDDKNLIKYNPNSDEENEIFTQFVQHFKEILKQYEEKRYYNHIEKAINTFNNFIDKRLKQIIGDRLQSYEYKNLTSSIRNAYRAVENWKERVDLKYEDPNSRNSEEPAVKEEEIQNIFKEYEIKRNSLIKSREDRKILKIIEERKKLESENT